MMIEIRGVGFVNKGAQLMLLAIMQQKTGFLRDADFAVEHSIGNYQQRAQLGLYQKIYIRRLGTMGSAIGCLLPWKLRQAHNLVTESEIHAVLDASGFNYGDQWGPQFSESMAKLTKRWRKQGKKVILLPQAFGPFKNVRVRKAFLQILENADLIFVRDKISYEYILNLTNQVSNCNVKMSPDFTNLLKGEIPAYFNGASQPACIIPNSRMIDKTSADVSKKYASFLIMCIRHLIEKGIDPFILVHETYDYEMALRLQSEVGHSIKIIQETNPQYIKGILSSCFIVIGSRFHGLISALSQGVPCLATGWSHKYHALLEDYHCPECLISPLDSYEEFTHKLTLITEEPTRSPIIQSLKQASLNQAKLVSEMWSEIQGVLQV